MHVEIVMDYNDVICIYRHYMFIKFCFLSKYVKKVYKKYGIELYKFWAVNDSRLKKEHINLFENMYMMWS